MLPTGIPVIFGGQQLLLGRPGLLIGDDLGVRHVVGHRQSLRST
jgi:hypothetical protein